MSESSETYSGLTPGITVDRALGIPRYTNENSGMGWGGRSGRSSQCPQIAHSGYFQFFIPVIGVLYVSESGHILFSLCMRMEIVSSGCELSGTP